MVKLLKRKKALSGGNFRTPTKASQDDTTATSATPPATPDSDEHLTNISVRIVTEPHPRIIQQHQQLPLPPSSGMSTTSSLFSFPPVATITVPGDLDDDDTETRMTLNTVPESTLVETVLMGIGCAPALSFLDGPSIGIGRGLMVIPENDYFTPPAAWGMAPSDDDSFDDDGNSFKNGNHMHDDFELILEDEEEDEEENKLHLPQPPPAPRNLHHNSTQGHFFCQPILPERKVDITTRNSRAVGVNPTNLDAQDPQSQKMTQQSPPSSQQQKEQQKQQQQHHLQQQQQQQQQRGRTTAIRFKSTPDVWTPGASISPTKSERTQASKNSKMQFFLFRSNSNHGGHNGDKRKNTSSSNRSKLFHIRFQKKKKNKNQKSSKSAKVVQVGRWKAVKDEASGKYYFYHTKTRQVTWNKPQGFVEWKATLDKNSGRHYFYNTITKETTWTKPDEFQEWKQVVDPKSGRSYFYNVLTRVASWNDPSKVIENRVANPDTKEKAKENSAVIEPEPIQNEDRSLSREDSTTIILVQRAPSPVESSNEKSLPEVQQVDKDCPEDEIDNTTEAVEPILSPEPIQTTSQSNASQLKESEHLAKLLSEYCPQDEVRNKALLSKVQGDESMTILGIQGLVEETPFDELHGAIAAFIKEAGVVEGPYKKETAKNRIQQKSNSKISTPPVTNYKPTSFHRVSTAISQKSVKTSATDQTNRVNNTTRNFVNKIEKSLAKPAPIESRENEHQLNESFEDLTDHSTDHEKGNVILDMNLINDSIDDGPSVEKKEVGRSLTDQKRVKSQIKETELDLDTKLVREQVSTKMNDLDEHTIESAYAGDKDDESETSWHDNDTISALSDSVGGPSSSKRRHKEKVRQGTKKRTHRPLARRKVRYSVRKMKPSYLSNTDLLLFIQKKDDDNVHPPIHFGMKSKQKFPLGNIETEIQGEERLSSDSGYQELFPRRSRSFSRSKYPLDEGAGHDSWDDNTVTSASSHE